MKKAIITFIAVFLPFLTFAQKDSITMERDGGVYKVPCEINGAKIKFVFDTGASMISISKNMAEYLLENGYLHKSDFEGTKEFIDANGNITTNQIVNIKDLSVVGLHIKDVKASISPSQNVPLLLGISAIQKLGKVTINGNVLSIDVGYEVNENNPTSLLGVSFGTSRSDVKKILEKKYNNDFHPHTDGHFDCVINVDIGGITFDQVDFCYDYSDILVGGLFIKDYKKDRIEKSISRPRQNSLHLQEKIP